MTFEPRNSPTIHEADALLDEYLPRMADLLDRPHVADSSWYDIRQDIRKTFLEAHFDIDEADIVFDVLCAVAERDHHDWDGITVRGLPARSSSSTNQGEK